MLKVRSTPSPDDRLSRNNSLGSNSTTALERGLAMISTTGSRPPPCRLANMMKDSGLWNSPSDLIRLISVSGLTVKRRDICSILGSEFGPECSSGKSDFKVDLGSNKLTAKRLQRRSISWFAISLGRSSGDGGLRSTLKKNVCPISCAIVKFRLAALPEAPSLRTKPRLDTCRWPDVTDSRSRSNEISRSDVSFCARGGKRARGC